MKKISVLALAPLSRPVLGVLHKKGAVQLVSVRSEAGGPGTGLAPVPVEDGGVDEQLEKARFCLRHIGRYWRESKGFLANFIGSRFGVARAELESAAGQVPLDHLYNVCSQAENRLEEVKQKRARARAQRQTLEAWQGLEGRLEELADTRRCRVMAGTVPLRELPRATELVQDVPVHLDLVGDDGRQAYVIVIALQGHPAAEAAVRDMGLTAVSLREFTGRAKELVASLDALLEELDQADAAIAAQAQDLAGEVTRLRLFIDYLSTQKQAGSGATDMGATAATVLLRGWCPARQVEDIRQALNAISPAIELIDEDPGPGDKVPVKLENPGLLQPFEVVTNIYGFPKYDEIDPTPFLAPFFFVFFGLALTDAGYGIVLTLLALLALCKLDIPKSGTKLIRLLVYGGISTVIFGALTGGWFGDLFEFLPVPALSQFRAGLTVLDPLQQPLVMLMLSLALGLFQIWFGTCIKMTGAFARGAVMEGLFDHAPWVFFLPALVFMAATVSGPLGPVGKNAALAGALWVMVGSARKQPNWFLKPFAGVFGLYGLIGYFSDTLSYARLLALGLATGVIASVVNQIAKLGSEIPVVGVLVFAGVVVGGHVFNLLINVLGSFIHAGRLQFVEFFTKFFEGGGNAFRPFREETEFVHIVD